VNETILLLTVAGLIMATASITAVFFLIREQRLAREKQQEPRRHTHSVNAGIEDAQSTLQNAYRLAQEARLQAEAIEFWASKTDSILRDMRQGPTAYDPDRPSGNRNEAAMHATGRPLQ
jgi:hypothetical protein